MHSNAPTVARDSSIVATACASRTTLQSTAVSLATVLGFVLLVALGAQVRVPVPGTEVPMTLQLLGVLLAGLLSTSTRAALGLSTYLLLGIVGLPVFSPGSGGIWGPTGGYLVGFIPAAWIVGLLGSRGAASVGRLFGSGAIGVVVVFICGTGWRIAWLAGDWRLALQTGLLPFILKAAVELCLAVTLVVSIRCWQERCGGADVSESTG